VAGRVLAEWTRAAPVVVETAPDPAPAPASPPA